MSSLSRTCSACGYLNLILSTADAGNATKCRRCEQSLNARSPRPGTDPRTAVRIPNTTIIDAHFAEMEGPALRVDGPLHVKLRNFTSVNSVTPMFSLTDGATVDAMNVIQTGTRPEISRKQDKVKRPRRHRSSRDPDQPSTASGVSASHQTVGNSMTDNIAYEGQDVYLSELVKDRIGPPMLKNLSFTRCQIHGPIMLAPMGALRLNECHFEVNDLEEMLYEVPDNSMKVGVVGVANCTFTNCNIAAVGFAGTKATLDAIRGQAS
jgi:hypothetical protein